MKLFNIEISLRNSPDRNKLGFGTQNFTEKFTRQTSWGSGPQTKDFTEKFTRQTSWGSGPQHKNFTEIHQTEQVGVQGPQKFTEKFTRQSKLGFGVTQKISLRNSPDRASWVR